MLQRIMKSPMSYFDTTPLGRIINRFAKDVDTVDNIIPVTLRTSLTNFLSVRVDFNRKIIIEVNMSSMF